MPHRWCRVCCTPVEGAHRCPGPLLATGHERHGFRVHVETPRGLLAYGVLVAPSGDLWRARIVTYPNSLWTLPGGGGSVKFAGRTPREAEGKAAAFVREHCIAKGYRRRDALDPVVVGAIAAEAGERPAASRPKQASKRKLCHLALRFGSAKPVRSGTAVNVSRGGMFIGTPIPMDMGQSVEIRLDVAGYTLPLRGIVIWNRRRLDPGRPLGMGIRLVDPVPSYPEYVDSLP